MESGIGISPVLSLIELENLEQAPLYARRRTASRHNDSLGGFEPAAVMVLEGRLHCLSPKEPEGTRTRLRGSLQHGQVRAVLRKGREDMRAEQWPGRAARYALCRGGEKQGQAGRAPAPQGVASLCHLADGAGVGRWGRLLQG